MYYIVPIAVIALLLLQFSGAIPQASVGGPMTIAAVVFTAVLAVAIHDAWSHKRGIVGWIVNILVAFVGAFVAAEIGGFVMTTLLMLLHFEGSLARTQGPLLYGSLVLMMLFPLLGSWLALRLVDRWR